MKKELKEFTIDELRLEVARRDKVISEETIKDKKLGLEIENRFITKLLNKIKKKE